MAAARRRDDDGVKEWYPAEIGRSFERIEEDLRDISGKLDTLGNAFVYRNEWNQRLVGTDQRMSRIEADISSIESRLLGTGARVTQIVTPIIAGLALVISIFRGA